MAHVPTFFERFGFLGACVLPATVLNDTPLTDPETGQIQPSLRQRCQDGSLCSGLCYAHVLSTSSAEGLYWADVAATPDLADAEHVVLTEADLTYALAWDERLYWRTPAQIRCLMEAQARDLAPLCPHKEPAPEAVLLPVPEVPLAVVDTQVEVTASDLRTVLAPMAATRPPERSGACAVQQGLLRVLHRALQQQIAFEHDFALNQHRAQALDALAALVTRVQHWQNQTRQRVVNAVREWCAARQCWVWHLILGVPEALLAAGDTVAAA